MESNNDFNPDWCSPPGDTLREIVYTYWCDTLGVSYFDFEKLLNGDLPINFDLAIELENVTKVPAKFWINREKQFRDGLDSGKQWYKWILTPQNEN